MEVCFSENESAKDLSTATDCTKGNGGECDEQINEAVEATREKAMEKVQNP